MKHRDIHKDQMAAYLGGRLSCEEAAAFESRLADDLGLFADAQELRPVADWLADGIASGPSTDFRLSADRLAVIRAAARGDIVAFPGADREQAEVRPRYRNRWAKKYALAAAAMVAMMVGGISGFESGRVQFGDHVQPRSIRLAFDPGNVAVPAEYTEIVHPYPPAYGLDHADFAAMRGNRHPHASVASVVARVSRDYGLPGPRSPYLSSREILFLQ